MVDTKVYFSSWVEYIQQTMQRKYIPYISCHPTFTEIILILLGQI